MKVTPKQLDEISFLEEWGIRGHAFASTQEERKEFINNTVHGHKLEISIYGWPINRLAQAKRFVEITIAMWKEDLDKGILLIDELYEDFAHTKYGKKLIDAVLKSTRFSPSGSADVPEVSLYNHLMKSILQHD